MWLIMAAKRRKNSTTLGFQSGVGLGGDASNSSKKTQKYEIKWIGLVSNSSNYMSYHNKCTLALSNLTGNKKLENISRQGRMKTAIGGGRPKWKVGK